MHLADYLLFGHISCKKSKFSYVRNPFKLNGDQLKFFKEESGYVLFDLKLKKEKFLGKLVHNALDKGFYFFRNIRYNFFRREF